MSVTTWRYAVPSIRGEGWAIAFIDSIGCVAVLSDWGDYAYRWPLAGFRPGEDVRRFLTECDDGYLLSKFSPRRDWFDLDRSLAMARDAIEAAHRAGEGGEWCDSELEAINAIGDEHEWDEWRRDTSLVDAWELGRYDHQPQARAFLRKAWPRLMALVRADLGKESAEVRP